MGWSYAESDSRVPLATYLHSDAAYLTSWQSLPSLGGAGIAVAKLMSKRFDDVTVNVDFTPEEGAVCQAV